MAMDQNKLTNRIIGFDFIRVISALLIILYHFNVEIMASYPGAMILGTTQLLNQGLGDLGVTLFIMLSGAALMINADDNFSSLNFFKKRILAIYPPYWMAYLAVVVFRRIFRGGHLGGDGHYWKFILSFTGFDGFLTYRMTDYYLVGEWFTGFILLVYLFFPVLRYGLLKLPAITWLVLFSVMGVVSFYYQELFIIPEKLNPLVRLPEFFFGMFFVQYIYNKKPFVYVTAISIALVLIFSFWNPPLPVAIYRLVSNAALFVTAAYIFKNASGNKFNNVIAYLAKYCFVAFLLHHQIIYYLSRHIDATKLNYFTITLYFIGIATLSFGGAIALDKPIRKVTDYLKRYLYKPRTIQPAI
jgi:peptidoglycan/LPS O-acetylase OafA/YrhL